jgi:SAM-dependent methyltransferase
LSNPPYAFGDDDTATERLRMLAYVFAPEIKSFLHHVPPNPGLVIDLGCGPGFTTRLLADTINARKTVGLDTSQSFLSIARSEPRDGLEFVNHDVTQAPFPTGAADVLFCHLLLPHLADPAAALRTWASQLRSAGLLLVDEVSDIQTANPTFRTYLNAAERLLDGIGGDLYVGRRVERLGRVPGLRRISSRLVKHPVATAACARMFRLNLDAWGPNPHAGLSAEDIGHLAGSLDDLATSTATNEIHWQMRQIVFKATTGS